MVFFKTPSLLINCDNTALLQGEKPVQTRVRNNSVHGLSQASFCEKSSVEAAMAMAAAKSQEVAALRHVCRCYSFGEACF
jgi:hypothetical protein